MSVSESRLRLMEARLEETALEPRTRMVRREGGMLEPGASSRMSSRIPSIYSRARIHEQPTSRKSVTFSQTTEQAVNSRVPTDYSNSSFISNSSSRLNLSPRGLVTLRERREEDSASEIPPARPILVSPFVLSAMIGAMAKGDEAVASAAARELDSSARVPGLAARILRCTNQNGMFDISVLNG